MTSKDIAPLEAKDPELFAMIDKLKLTDQNQAQVGAATPASAEMGLTQSQSMTSTATGAEAEISA